MENQEQNYQNHVRWHPLFHFFAMPVVILHFIWTLVVLIRQAGGWQNVENLVLAGVLVATVFLTRINALKAQDRVIRLEEQLRFQRLFPKDFAQHLQALSTSQLIALRFASDEELPELIQKIKAKNLTTSDEIKKAIKNWRADHLRV
jgi:hypothetical protein